MRALLLLAVLLPVAAQADELTQTERTVLAGAIGGAIVTYGVVSTILMMDDLFERGYSEPSRTVPAGFLAAAAFVASTAVLVNWARARDEVGVTGGAMMTTASLAMCFFVTLSIHGWMIRQQRPGD